MHVPINQKGDNAMHRQRDMQKSKPYGVYTGCTPISDRLALVGIASASSGNLVSITNAARESLVPANKGIFLFLLVQEDYCIIVHNPCFCKL